ncbi:hypothetical protein [Burkholderia cepacia]|uniref:hypothetical protein n=1 Tax=Burkholderia cepacia TaxID=292 RepID=UPI002650BDBE|nr:hypothetical protein [Burkholderia cepacia]MDN7915343.1 hypothetical protein [Burkholderia cepacia]
MDEEINSFLSLLRQDSSTAWVADQLTQTFSQGISMSVKEASSDAQFSEMEPIGLSSRERQKREKYETTRPYSSDEKIELLRSALRTLFIELPEIQVTAIDLLRSFGAKADHIEFVPPDEPEQGQFNYSLEFGAIEKNREHSRNIFTEFDKEFAS